MEITEKEKFAIDTQLQALGEYTMMGGRKKVPHHVHQSIALYVVVGCPVGSFLQAVISNNLSESVGRADDQNLENLPALIGFLYNHTPAPCWGSPKAYTDWINRGGLLRHVRKDDYTCTT